jgi:hypothetical protein
VVLGERRAGGALQGRRHGEAVARGERQRLVGSESDRAAVRVELEGPRDRLVRRVLPEPDRVGRGARGAEALGEHDLDRGVARHRHLAVERRGPDDPEPLVGEGLAAVAAASGAAASAAAAGENEEEQGEMWHRDRAVHG